MKVSALPLNRGARHMRTIALLLAAMTLGVLGALFIPSEFALVPIVVPFALCIILGWYVAFQSKAIRLTPFRVFFWPWINVIAPLKESRALRALHLCVAFAAGACLGLLIHVAIA
jgi:hypothetical protein